LRNLRPEFTIEYKEHYLENSSCRVKDNNPSLVDIREENTVHIKAGDRVVQAIFIPTLPADNCNGNAERTGGVGSTGR
jgi:hypothetical protein